MGRMTNRAVQWAELKFWGGMCKFTDARDAIRLSSGLLLAIIAALLILAGAGIALIASGKQG